MSQVGDWLIELGLEQFLEVFLANQIEFGDLTELNEIDLRELGLPMGPRKRLLKAIADLSSEEPQSTRDLAEFSARSQTTNTGAGKAERRQLTVMFCDLASSTELSERFDAEDLSEIVRAYQRCCEEITNRYDGYIAKYMGDGILVYFGYPTAHEDDAERALRVGLAIVDHVSELEPRPGLFLSVRIGVATGQVVVGETIGEGSSQEQMVVGETPNLAARLQSLAKLNTMVIGPVTQRLANNRFEYDDLGLHSLKGFSEPVRAWVVAGVRDIEADGPLGSSSRHALVGRESEMQTLRSLWLDATRAKGHAVQISGEPGIGKSRLIEALCLKVDQDNMSQIVFNCSSYYTNSALYPVQKFFEVLIGKTEQESPEKICAKIERLLAGYQFADESTTALLADLLGVPIPDSPSPIQNTPEQQKRLIQVALVEWIAEEANRQPVLMVWEDLQWADPSTLELLGLFLDYVPTSAMLMLVTARNDFQPPWSDRPALTQMKLSGLNTSHVEKISQNITGGTVLPAELLATIVQRSDGVPLFVEEMTKSIIESGMVRRVNNCFEMTRRLDDAGIPITLQELLMARLDRLGTGKTLAQTASVIGREFDYGLLRSVSVGTEAALGTELQRLIESGLVERGEFPTQSRYVFKHAMMQDTAYRSLLRRHRETLHLEIAETIEADHTGELGDHDFLLAHHFSRSAQPFRALVYTLRAGDNSVRMHARTEAEVHFRHALSIIQSLPETRESLQKQIDTILKLASVTDAREDSDQDMQNLKHARSIAESLQDQSRLAQVLYWLGRLCYAGGDGATAAHYAEQSLAIADALENESLAAPPVNLLGRFYALQGDVTRGSEILTRSVEQMHRIGDTAEEATAAGYAGMFHAWKGDFSQAFTYADRGISLAKQLENPFAEAAGYCYRGIAHLQRGTWTESLADFEKSREIADATGDEFRRYIVNVGSGEALTGLANLADARVLLEDAIAFAEKAETTFFLGTAKRSYAAALFALGEHEQAYRECQESIDISDREGHHWSKSRSCQLQAAQIVKLDNGDILLAEELIKEAFDSQKKYGADPELARSYRTYARVLQKKCAFVEAKKHHQTAREMFERMGMYWDLSLCELDSIGK